MAEEQEKPLIGKFEVLLPREVNEEEFKAKITGTGPKSTSTGGVGGAPADSAADLDVDF